MACNELERDLQLVVKQVHLCSSVFEAFRLLGTFPCIVSILASLSWFELISYASRASYLKSHILNEGSPEIYN